MKGIGGTAPLITPRIAMAAVILIDQPKNNPLGILLLLAVACRVQAPRNGEIPNQLIMNGAAVNRAEIMSISSL